MLALHTPRPLKRPRLRLFVFPYAGGSASIFYPWSRLLPSDVELNIYQYPGHGERLNEPLLQRVEPLIDEMLETLSPLLLESETPTLFWGHSLGALLAYQLAQQLNDRSLPLPKRLIVSGRPAPTFSSPERMIHSLPDDEFDQSLREMEGTSEEILANPELMAMLRPILRADLEMVECWKPSSSKPLPILIDVLGGEEEFGSRLHELAAWEEETSLGCEITLFPGGHFFIHAEQTAVAHFLSKRLESHRVEESGRRGVG